MSYTKRVWGNTGEEVTYEDFNRIEQGIESNDLEISKQKDATKEGSLAKQIADIKDETQEGSLAQKIADAEEQINVLSDSIAKEFTINSDMMKNGWSIVKGHPNAITKVSNNTFLLNLRIKSGVITNGTIIADLSTLGLGNTDNVVFAGIDANANNAKAYLRNDGMLIAWFISDNTDVIF